VCKAWLDSFETFREWSLATGYHKTLQLDRINNDGNYEPTNCRWADEYEQANNKRPSIDDQYGKNKSLKNHQKYKLRHKNEVRESYARWYNKNKNYHKIYREKNKEKINDYQKQYYWKNKETAL